MSHMSFRLVQTSMTLNNFERP